MTRKYNERRNQQIFVLIERRGMSHKDIAKRLRLTLVNIRQIIFRHRQFMKRAKI